MSVWNDKNGHSSTSWGVQDGVTSSWDSKEEFDAVTTQMGEILGEAGIQGTYTSGAQAASSFLGGKYHLSDNRDFKFGHLENYKIRYDATEDTFLFHTGAHSLVNKTVLKLRNYETDIFSIYSDGTVNANSVKYANHNSLPDNVEAGKVIFHNNDLYIGEV